MGAYIALFAVMIWSSRAHLGEVIRQTLQTPRVSQDEIISCRSAIIGLVGGMIGLIVL